MKNKVFSFWDEFKTFAFKGDVIDLAVGIIIGTGFNKLVQSLVDDIVMPPFGKLLGNADFSNLYINLSDTSYASLNAAEQAGAPVIRYGQFLTNVLDFLIVALTVFLVLRVFLKLKREKEVEKKEK